MSPAMGDAMGPLDFIGDLDRSKIVALGFAPVYGGPVGELRLLNLPMKIKIHLWLETRLVGCGWSGEKE